ncbi:MAG: acyltransferase [Planctomycetota bacterium]|nr:acyltransferase [Planctomycetota bacterium]MDA1161730.1 acyltransferase [Planctomycetota bacterium]
MKSVIKKLASFTALLLVLPAYGLYRLGAALIGRDRAFHGWSETFSLLPGLSGQYLRRAFYSLTLERCGENACLSFGSILSHSTASVGANVYVGSYCSLGSITLEDDVLIASNVSIMNGSQQHGIERIDIPIREQPGLFLPVTIGEGAWIGEGATVSADVGRHCVIGAGSVVTKPIPDYAIAVGVPAKVIRFRNADVPIENRLAETERLVNSVVEES